MFPYNNNIDLFYLINQCIEYINYDQYHTSYEKYTKISPIKALDVNIHISITDVVSMYLF
jgi:hypothetical protein